MTLAVVILMAFVLKKKQYRDVGRLALAPGIFNVNEPAIFGMPIVLNATILIPWVVAPLVVTTFNLLGDGCWASSSTNWCVCALDRASDC